MDYEKEIQSLYKEIAGLRKLLGKTVEEPQNVVSAADDKLRRDVDGSLIAYQTRVQQIEAEAKKREEQLLQEIERLKKQVEKFDPFVSVFKAGETPYRSGETPFWDGQAQQFIPKKIAQFDPSHLGDGPIHSKDGKMFARRLEIGDFVPNHTIDRMAGPVRIENGVLSASDMFAEREHHERFEAVAKHEFNETFITEMIIDTMNHPVDAEGNKLDLQLILDGRTIDLSGTTGKRILFHGTSIGYTASAELVTVGGEMVAGYVDVGVKTVEWIKL